MSLKTKKGFDNVSWFYDFLSSLIFGHSLIKAQYAFLSVIRNHHRVLIIGGGTGKILNKIAQLAPNCHIDYVEASSKMLKKSKKRKHQHVHYIHGDEYSIPQNSYDIIITFFFLDLFPQQKFNEIFPILDSHLQTKGIWLFTDFYPNTHKIKKKFIGLMYWFFRKTAQVQAKRLPDFNIAFSEYQYQKCSSHFFYFKIIQSVHYEKN